MYIFLDWIYVPKIFSLSENLFKKQSKKGLSSCFNKHFIYKEEQID